MVRLRSLRYDIAMSETFLITGPDNPPATILLAHGAGAPMDSKSMTAASEALVGKGFRIARFEFAYMAARRTSDARKPPPKAETLIPEYMEAVKEVASSGPLIIGGKSMGGRVASIIADELYDQGAICGLLCLGYPFHPPGKPQQLRTAHLRNLRSPTNSVRARRSRPIRFPPQYHCVGSRMATTISRRARRYPASPSPIISPRWQRASRLGQTKTAFARTGCERQFDLTHANALCMFACKM
jgi:predicted alpha/beta-hydrolase family hydrolase